jgi:hypothetical protein
MSAIFTKTAECTACGALFLAAARGSRTSLETGRDLHRRPGVLYLLLLFVAGRCPVPMDETELFFNLRLGEVVLRTGHVPTKNLLSFTHPTVPDINLAWLFQILLAWEAAARAELRRLGVSRDPSPQNACRP